MHRLHFAVIGRKNKTLKKQMQLTGTSLTVRRRGGTLFPGLDFALASGHLLTVIGPNGAGKSTLLRIIAGLHEPLIDSVRIEQGGRILHPAAYSHTI